MDELDGLSDLAAVRFLCEDIRALLVQLLEREVSPAAVDTPPWRPAAGPTLFTCEDACWDGAE